MRASKLTSKYEHMVASQDREIEGRERKGDGKRQDGKTARNISHESLSSVHNRCGTGF
jgi:hypothetical protein